MNLLKKYVKLWDILMLTINIPNYVAEEVLMQCAFLDRPNAALEQLADSILAARQPSVRKHQRKKYMLSKQDIELAIEAAVDDDRYEPASSPFMDQVWGVLSRLGEARLNRKVGK